MSGVNIADRLNEIFDDFDFTTNGTNGTYDTNAKPRQSADIMILTAWVRFAAGDSEGLESSVGALIAMLADENTSEEDKIEIRAFIEELGVKVDKSGNGAMQDSFYDGLETGHSILRGDRDADEMDVVFVHTLLAERPDKSGSFDSDDQRKVNADLIYRSETGKDPRSKPFNE